MDKKKEEGEKKGEKKGEECANRKKYKIEKKNQRNYISQANISTTIINSNK